MIGDDIWFWLAEGNVFNQFTCAYIRLGIGFYSTPPYDCCYRTQDADVIRRSLSPAAATDAIPLRNISEFSLNNKIRLEEKTKKKKNYSMD